MGCFRFRRPLGGQGRAVAQLPAISAAWLVLGGRFGRPSARPGGQGRAVTGIGAFI
jgi:hypothetical protein